MNLLHLQYFYVVAKEQGFTKASKALRIQQPAISRMVKLLEEDLGIRLFEKIGRNIHLTAQGHEVFQHCKKIFGSVEDLKQSLGQISGSCQGPLLIGASEPIVSHYIPEILTKYFQIHPLVYPNIYSGPASTIFYDLTKGLLEFGMFFHTPELPDQLEIFEVKEFRHRLVVRKDLKRNKEVISKFIGSREIDDTSTKKFPTLERLKNDYPKAYIKISSNNLTAHKSMVLNGLGVSILPDFLIKQEIKDGVLSDLYPQEKFEFKMKFTKRKSAVLSRAALDLVKICIEN
ncbi:MAG: LysR family transcriptional regulator [Pseudobdellovibrio sp.]